MTTTEDVDQFLAQAKPKIKRAAYGRPVIALPMGARSKTPKLKTYTRTSTVGKTLDDGTGLTNWKLRNAVIGVTSRPDLVLAATSHRFDDERMNEIVEQGMEAAGTSSAATIGTALHNFCDAYDHGLEPYVPALYAADVQAYLVATVALEPVVSEAFGVCDELEVGGTPDRIYQLLCDLQIPGGPLLPAGTLIVGDIKTGKSLDYGHVAFGVQIAIYARSQWYDISAGRTVHHYRWGDVPVGDRRPWVYGEQVNTDWGLIIHVHAGRGTATVHAIDLTLGWQLAELAINVRKIRSTKTISGPLELIEDYYAAAEAALTLDDLWAVYARAQLSGRWNEHLRAAFSRRKTELEIAA